MICQPGADHIEDIVTEAAGRIEYVEAAIGADDFGKRHGYDREIAREVLLDVAATLRKAVAKASKRS